MTPSPQDILFNHVPSSIRSRAQDLDLPDSDVLFCARSDLDLEGQEAESWLIVSPTRIAGLTIDPQGRARATGPFTIADIEKVKSLQTVGSAFLQLRINGLYVDALRYSNARRELFGRVRLQIERLVSGLPIQKEALSRPSELVCPVCGLPLPNRGAACPRCRKGHGVFRRTLRLMRPYRTYVFLLLLMMLAGVGLRLVPPYLTRILIDDVLTPRTNAGWLTWILLALVIAAATQGLLNVFIGRTTHFIGTRITKDMRQRLLNKLLSVSVDFYDRQSVGYLMSRVLHDVQYFQGFVRQVAGGFLLNLMTVVGIGAVMFWMNPRLAVLVLLPTPFVILGTMFFWKYIYPKYFKVWDSQSKLSQLLSGQLSGIRLVKAFAQEHREKERFDQAANYLRDANRSVLMSTATFYPIMTFFFGLGALIIWYVGGDMILATPPGMTVGTLIAFIAYSAMFYAPLTELSTFGQWVTGFLTGAHRTFEILDASSAIKEPDHPEPVPEMRGTIELRNVTFGYDPYQPVIKNVSLKIEPGQFVGIVGKSGCGKTTLVNLICRFYDAQSGQVLLDDTDVRRIRAHDIHRNVGLVLQEPFLFRASIYDNIAYGRPDATPMTVVNAAKAANAHEFTVRKPAGYDTRLGEHGAGLSGGERQRVGIARAILCDPKILILDEATSSVDTESEQMIQRALAEISKTRTTIAIAHRLSTLKNADVIYVMDDGRITESGTHGELMAHRGVYYKLVKIQTELAKVEVEEHV